MLKNTARAADELSYSEDFLRIEQVFEFLARTKIGSRILADFRPKLQSGEIKIVEVDDLSLHPSIADIKLTGAPAAGFVYDGKSKTILIEKNLEIGLMAPLLFHEMVHSIDAEFIRSYHANEQLWRTFHAEVKFILKLAAERVRKTMDQVTGEDLLPGEMNRIVELKEKCQKADHRRLFQAERKAYTLLSELIHEFCALNEEYQVFIKRQRCKGYVLDRPITDEEIIQIYRLERRYLLD